MTIDHIKKGCHAMSGAAEEIVGETSGLPANSTLPPLLILDKWCESSRP